jgi:hypothetical protein
MKKYFFPLLLLTILAVSCSSRKEILLSVSNPLDRDREDAAILLTRNEISGWIEIPGGMLPVLYDEKGDPVPCQADDVDGDGTWDELFALMDLEAGGSKKITLAFISGAYPEFRARTNVRLGAVSLPGYPDLQKAERLEGITYYNHGRTGEVFQMEGPAWENDLVGFRNYLDQRNGMDIFGKLTHEMVLDSVGIPGAPSYHEPGPWGQDVLKVNTSLGAGAIGYMFNDSIYRVGDSGSGTYELLFEGTQRSRFRLTYSNWMVDGSPVEVEQLIEIAGGRRYYESNVTYSGTQKPLDLVPGIVNILSDTLYVFELDAHHTGFVTHDVQAEDSSLLAMALMVPDAYLLKYGETPDTGDGIIQTYYVVLDASEGIPVPYRFYSFWEREDPRWSSLEEIEAYLEGEAERWTQSVVVQVLR